MCSKAVRSLPPSLAFSPSSLCGYRYGTVCGAFGRADQGEHLQRQNDKPLALHFKSWWHWRETGCRLT